MTNAMFNLEHSTEDKVKVSKLAPTLTRLEDIRDKWDDDFAINQKLRKKFRTEKREIQDKEVCEGFFFPIENWACYGYQWKFPGGMPKDEKKRLISRGG